MNISPKCIEIYGSGALGRFLAINLSEKYKVSLRSIRTEKLIKSSFLLKDGIRKNYNFHFDENKIKQDLVIFCGLLSHDYKLKDNTPFLCLSNLSGFLLNRNNQLITGCVEALAVELSANNECRVKNITNKIPIISYERKIDFEINTPFVSSRVVNNQIILTKSLRTLYYALMSFDGIRFSAKNFQRNILNKSICAELSEGISLYASNPSEFLKSNLEFSQSLPREFVPTICRDELHFEKERKLMMNLFYKWTLHYNLPDPQNTFSSMNISKVFNNE